MSQIKCESCTFSRAMNQKYPRLCIKCGTPELVDENNYPLFEGVINLAKEKQQQPMKTAMQEWAEARAMK